MGKTRKASWKRCKTPILTSSLHKNELVAAKEWDKGKNSSKFLSLLTKGTNKCERKEKKKSKRIFQYWSDDSDEVVDNDGDAQSLYHQDWYSKSTECRITCSKCHNWVHNSCGRWQRRWRGHPRLLSIHILSFSDTFTHYYYFPPH